MLKTSTLPFLRMKTGQGIYTAINSVQHTVEYDKTFTAMSYSCSIFFILTVLGTDDTSSIEYYNIYLKHI